MRTRQRLSGPPDIRKRIRRRGAALLLLVSAVLGLVGFSAKTMMTSGISRNIAEQSRRQIKTMESAIELAQGWADQDFAHPILLDMPDPEQSIELSLSADPSYIRARWIRRGRQIATLLRPRETPSEDLEP